MGRLILLIILNIVLDVLAGIWAWNIVDPYDFWEGLLFMLLWGVFGTIVYWVCQFVIVILGALFE
jgi:hypothetical protein